MTITYTNDFTTDPLAQLHAVGLQMPGGQMFRRALREHAPAVVAWDDRSEHALGWAALFAVGKERLPGIMAYVRPSHRRRGIGRRLVTRLMDKHGLWGDDIYVWDHSRRSTAFFNSTIVENKKGKHEQRT
jgi:GNAT superfamily N-acetyltransferase